MHVYTVYSASNVSEANQYSTKTTSPTIHTHECVKIGNGGNRSGDVEKEEYYYNVAHLSNKALANQ